MKESYKQPDVYRIIFRIGRWKTKSTRYYTANDAQEAFNDLLYAFEHDRIKGRSLKVFSVDKYDRYADKWHNEIDLVTELSDVVTRKRNNLHIKLTDENKA